MTRNVAARVAAISKAKGTSVVFRRVTSTGGASPATNPVTGAITVATAALAGASTVTLTAPVGAWLLEAGDVLAIGGSDYTVTARTLSASGKFTGVPVSPVLAAGVSAGAAVAVTWQADYPCRAMVDGYATNLIDGTTIKAQDLRCKLPTTSTDGRTLPQPSALDKVIIGGASRSIGIVKPYYAGAGAAWWEVQARG